MNNSEIQSKIDFDRSLQKKSNGSNQNQLWKLNDAKAQKNTPHAAIYWVKRHTKNEDGSMKQQKWVADQRYIGDWKDNKKSGFGVQYYGNGDKYEGGWEESKRTGQGTYWVYEGKNKMRREYTGDWLNDKKTGRGTMFYPNGNRYDGLWLDDKPHGEGRMIYANGDVYEGMWFMAQRSGYGVVTKRNGDHFEGHWVNDKREGQGSYFYASKNQVFVGEWVDDMPKTGVYSEVEDPLTQKLQREKHFMDPYILPEFPKISLKNPTAVLQESMENVRRDRTIYRAKFIPIDELYSKEELADLIKEFSSASNDKGKISLINVQAILVSMNFDIQEQQLDTYLKMIQANYISEEIDFELFARLVAIILEISQFNDIPVQQQPQEDIFQDQFEDQQEDQREEEWDQDEQLF